MVLGDLGMGRSPELSGGPAITTGVLLEGGLQREITAGKAVREEAEPG